MVRGETAGDAVAAYAEAIDGATGTVSVDGGRTLAYAEFGDRSGEPVFAFHGGIGSRGFGLLFDGAASRLGIRVISPDPGRSETSPRSPSGARAALRSRRPRGHRD